MYPRNIFLDNLCQILPWRINLLHLKFIIIFFQVIIHKIVSASIVIIIISNSSDNDKNNNKLKPLEKVLFH